MKADVFDLTGNKVGSVNMPSHFAEKFRPDLIKRAVLAEQTWRLQPKAAYRWAGLQTSAEYIGERRKYHQMINIGRARLPKEKLPKGGLGKVRIVPFSVKGRRAHAPKIEKVFVEEINKKERNKAIRCAIAATSMKEIVAKRGHNISGVKEIPFIIDNSIENVKKAKELFIILEKLGFSLDMQRAQKRKAKSLLIVVGKDSGIMKAARNLPGIDARVVSSLDAEVLAPGATPGRLTIWTKDAVEKLQELYW